MAIGTTIDGLNDVTSLTAQDEVPVWDAEASGEPTKKITAQNMAASVKSLASLPNTTEMNNAIQQSTARSTVQGLSGAATGVTLKGTLTYDPVAKTVRIYLSARSGSDISTSTVLANIPAAYRPSSTVQMVGFFTLSNGVSATYEALITSQGNVTQSLSSTVREAFIVGEYSLD